MRNFTIALVAFLVGLGCAPTARRTNDPRDGGGNGNGGDGGNGGGGGGGSGGGAGSGASGPCIEGDPVCDGANLRTCKGGVPSGPVTDSCADACSNGRCTSRACAEAERQRTFVGCMFYTFDADNTPGDNKFENMLALGNQSASEIATVTVQHRASAGAPWTDWKTATLKPGGVAAVPFGGDSHLDGPGIGVAHAFRVVSDLPVAAYHVQSDDKTGESASSGGTILIPAHVLGTDYLPITYTHKTTDLMTAGEGPTFYGPRAAASQVTIVAAHDATTVTFTVSTAVTEAGGGIPSKGPGESFDAKLDDGDIMQVYSSKEGDDLTGSFIHSDKPVLVFSGNIATSYALDFHMGVASADMAHEQIIPLQAWGKQYVASRILPQVDDGGTCAGSGGTGPKDLRSWWRILASENGTTVRFEAGSPLVVGVPDMPVKLDKGKFIELAVGGPKGADGDFFIDADKPVLVAQFPACEPALALAVSAEQLLTDFLFVTPPIFDHEVVITRRASSPVMLDGKGLMDSLFTPAGGGFEVARLDLPKCTGGPSLAACGHRLTGTQIGVAVRGQDTLCGYAFSGGMGVRCVNRTAGCP